MQKISLITVGRLKEQYFRDAAAEYKKRLSAFCDFSETVLEPVKLPDAPSGTLIESALEKEYEMIISKIPKGSVTVALCVEGKKLSSEKFAKIIKENSDFGSGSITFIVGSSYGLCEELKKKCDLRISMSDMTFPHRIAHIMLLEQIYRGYMINRGSTYHK